MPRKYTISEVSICRVEDKNEHGSYYGKGLMMDERSEALHTFHETKKLPPGLVAVVFDFGQQEVAWDDVNWTHLRPRKSE